MFLLFALGPNYVGEFTETLDQFQTYDLLSASNISLYRSHLELLNNIGQFSLAPLADRYLLLFNARDCCTNTRLLL